MAKWTIAPVNRLWRTHPGVRTDEALSPGERAADRMRNLMGSWGFVAAALMLLAGWMIGNGSHGFDPYPFILLNLILSCIAALQGAILLIAAKRADQIAAELAIHDYETNQRSLAILTELRTLVVATEDPPGEITDPSRG
jgi:uncharacterized membrane protein